MSILERHMTIIHTYDDEFLLGLYPFAWLAHLAGFFYCAGLEHVCVHSVQRATLDLLKYYRRRLK